MSADPGPEAEPAGHSYDPELPFLEALEREVRRKALRAARRSGASQRPRPDTLVAEALPDRALPDRPPGGARRPRRGARRSLQGAPRIARRSLTLVTLLCLIGASAFGASKILSAGAHNPTVVQQGPFALVASGHAGTDGWSLRLYRRAGDLCRVLVVAETESSRCAPAPGPRAFATTSLVSPLRRYVFGVTGNEIAHVSVHVGNSMRTVATFAPNATATRGAGLPAGVRWYIAVLSRPTHGSDPTAYVSGLDPSGRTLGPVRISCVEAAEPQPCR
jgi:hypothetical protein